MTMLDVDFLPLEYRQRRERRRVSPWQLMAIAGVVALIGAAAASQRFERQRVERELAAVRPLYDQALSQQKQWTEAQSQLGGLRQEAELYTYLKYPWPKTQLLAALLTPLPDDLQLDQVQMVRETVAPSGLPDMRPRAAAAAEDATKLSPAERDLRRLREECDKTRTLIRISGTTADSAALHNYLGTLGRHELFAKAELDSLERQEIQGTPTLRFKATVVVRPGYGQPGGRTTPAKTAVAHVEPTRP